MSQTFRSGADESESPDHSSAFRMKSSHYLCAFPHVCFVFLSEFLDDCCYPAGGGLLCQRSDTRWGDGTDEGNAAFHTGAGYG